MTDQESPVDTNALVAKIQANVAAKRAKGEYPAELRGAVSKEFDISQTSDPPEVLSLIQSARPIRSNKAVLGPVVVFGKRAARRLLAWYIHPITADQTRFNDSITREFRKLEAKLHDVEPIWSPAKNASLPPAAEHAKAIARALDETEGQVLVAGASGVLLQQLQVAVPTTRTFRTIQALKDADVGSLTGVVLTGSLQRMSAAELIEVIGLAHSRLRAGGRLLVDGPVPVHSGSPSDVDAAMTRWVGADTVERWLQAAGFGDLRHQAISGTPPWYLIVASRID